MVGRQRERAKATELESLLQAVKAKGCLCLAERKHINSEQMLHKGSKSQEAELRRMAKIRQYPKYLQ